MTRIEVLADAFSHLNGFSNPTSRAYKNRNPGLLKAFMPKHAQTEDGLRVFNSVSSGYDNLVQDLLIKCEGKSRCHLKTTDTLRDLVKVYGNDASSTRGVKNFIRHALDTEDVYENTELSWFLEDKKEKEINGSNS